MMSKLHPTQNQLLELLRKNHTDPLSMRELQEELNLSSASLVYHHISQLEKKGLLRRNPANPQDYQVLSELPENAVEYINLYGMAQCGPSGQFLDGTPIDQIPVSTRLLGFPSREAFIVKAKGNSMSPTIKENDLIIARKTNGNDVSNNSIVVCTKNNAVLVKRIKKFNNNNFLILESDNEKFDPIPVSADDDFNISGIVKSVISYKK